MTAEFNIDVGIIGGGVAGLETARGLSQHGYRVAVFDRSPSLADGTSVRNHRYVHAGTFHGAQPSPGAVEVARQTKIGYDRITSFASEAIDRSIPTYVLLYNAEDAIRAARQWDEAGVTTIPVSNKVFTEAHPEMRPKGLTVAYRSIDVTIDPRKYYRKLIQTGLDQGVQYVTGATVCPEDTNRVAVTVGDETFGVNAQAFVVNAGNGTADVYKQVTGADLPVSYTKVQMLAFPDALTPSNILSVGPYTIQSVSYRGDDGKLRSIAGVNYQDYQVDRPDLGVDEEDVRLGFQRIQQVFPGANPDFTPLPSIKPTILGAAEDNVHALSARRVVHPDYQNWIFILPGKMTSAPVAAELALDSIQNGLHIPTTDEVAAITAANPDPQITPYPYERAS